MAKQPCAMKRHILLTIISIALTLSACHVMAEGGSTVKPYAVGRSYIIAFGPVTPALSVELPSGIAKVVGESPYGWVQIEYSTFMKATQDSESKAPTFEEKHHSAWINLDHVVAFIDAEK